jgi:competence protein ComGC
MVINNHGFTLIEALLSLIGVVLIGLLIPKTMLEGNRVIRETQIQTA